MHNVQNNNGASEPLSLSYMYIKLEIPA